MTNYQALMAELTSRTADVTAELRPLGVRPRELLAPRIPDGTRDTSAVAAWDAKVRDTVLRHFVSLTERSATNEIVRSYLNAIFVNPPDIYGLRDEDDSDGSPDREVTAAEVAAFVSAAPAVALYNMFAVDED